MLLAREKKIVTLLIEHEDKLTTTQIATSLKVSSRTIKADIKKINEELEKQKEQDAMRIVLNYAQSYFVDCIHENTPGAVQAREAVKKRWGEDAIETFGIGYAS